jgi:hypothetical protein
MKTETIKTTLRLERPLWEAAKMRAIAERTSFQDLATKAIGWYLRQKSASLREDARDGN